DGFRLTFDAAAPGELVALSLSLPTFAARILLDALTALSEGHAVRVAPVPAELTTQETADILGVSRPYLVKLLDDRKLPYRRVGNRRKVLLEDVLRYKRSDDRFRQGILDELTREAQSVGLDY
ncbi:helix-turn-helix domain-containing protein, partial [Acidimicrobiaceae bacterium AH-315-P05]|nr:helix-turn-helix domain-containing protein [Acidimicrobiaceae bacterium AH-315-P05]